MPDVVQVRGLRVLLRRQGRGRAVLMLHGGMSDSREWRPQLSGLSPDHDVIAVDMLGCGGSSDPPARFSLEDHADVLAETLTALDLPSVDVVGLSLGSVLALALYAEHPERVRSMVLAGAYAGWAGSLPAEEVTARTQMVLATLEEPVDTWAPPFLATVYGPEADPAVVEEAMAILRDVRPEASRRLVLSIGAADLRWVLPTITVPVLLVYGAADRRASTTVAEQLHTGIAGSRLVYVPGAGHGVNTDAPDQFNTLVRDFLAADERRHPGGRGVV